VRSPNGMEDPDVTVERRHSRGRRYTDEHPMPPEGVVVWSARKLLTAFGLIVATASATLALGATIGLRWGPKEDIAVLQQAQRFNSARIDTLAAQLRNAEQDLRAIRVQQYVECTKQPKADVESCANLIR